MFDWEPLYKEIARKVLGFEDRQSELIELIKELKAKELPVIPTEDQTNGGRAELTEIDPFTFFASFKSQADSG